MPIRKIPKNYRSVTGTFASIKNKRNIAFESLLERDFFLTLEFDATVESYEEQPVEIFYEYRGRRTRYTPDCLVHYNDGRLPCIHEVKFSNEIKEKKVFLKAKFEQIEEYLHQNDMEFKLITEMDMDDIYLENIKFIYNYSVLKNQTKINYFKNILQAYEEIEFADLLLQYSSNKYEQAQATPYIWYLVLQKYISIDLYSPITPHTILKVSHE